MSTTNITVNARKFGPLAKLKLMRAARSSDLKPAEKIVFEAIIDRVGKDTGISWPGVETIAKDCNFTARYVQQIINDVLVPSGWLYVEHRGKRSNIYHPAFDRAATPPLNRVDRTAEKLAFRLQPGERAALRRLHPDGVTMIPNDVINRSVRGLMDDEGRLLEGLETQSRRDLLTLVEVSIEYEMGFLEEAPRAA